MTALTAFVEIDRRGRVAVITVNNPPNNVLSHGVRQGLKDGVVAASGDAAVSAIVITCAGRTFIAGGDTTEFVRPPQEPGLHEVLDLIEGSAKPVVAAIHGTALLGGLEVILACHYRVGVQAARFGLPGVTMGLLPGAGGTQRLPRLVGVEQALQMLEEQIAMRASDIDVIGVYGYGWPLYRGGPMFWADFAVGLAALRDRMLAYQQTLGGDHWQPAALLHQLADQGKTFTQSFPSLRIFKLLHGLIPAGLAGHGVDTAFLQWLVPRLRPRTPLQIPAAEIELYSRQFDVVRGW